MGGIKVGAADTSWCPHAPAIIDWLRILKVMQQ
jgi:hypothetical protein